MSNVDTKSNNTFFVRGVETCSLSLKKKTAQSITPTFHHRRHMSGHTILRHMSVHSRGRQENIKYDIPRLTSVPGPHQNPIAHPPGVLGRQSGVVLELWAALNRSLLSLRPYLLVENLSPVAHGHGHAGVLREADEVEVVRVR